MIKKYLPQLLLIAGFIVLIVLMITVNKRQSAGLGIMHPLTLTEAVLSILLMTFGIALLLKRL